MQYQNRGLSLVTSLLLIGAGFTLSACDSSGSNASSPLQGRWQSPCFAVTAQAGPQTMIQTLDFEADQMTTTSTSYSDGACSTPYLQEVQVYSFEIPAASSPVQPLNLQYLQDVMTPLSASAESYLVDHLVCGFHSWVQGSGTSIVGVICQGVQNPAVNSALYAAFENQNGSLLLSQSIATDPSERPTTVGVPIFTHQ